MQFANGQHCWNGPSRSLKLLFECGDANALVSVRARPHTPHTLASAARGWLLHVCCACRWRIRIAIVVIVVIVVVS